MPAVQLENRYYSYNDLVYLLENNKTDTLEVILQGKTDSYNAFISFLNKQHKQLKITIFDNGLYRNIYVKNRYYYFPDSRYFSVFGLPDYKLVKLKNTNQWVAVLSFIFKQKNIYAVLDNFLIDLRTFKLSKFTVNTSINFVFDTSISQWSVHKTKFKKIEAIVLKSNYKDIIKEYFKILELAKQYESVFTPDYSLMLDHFDIFKDQDKWISSGSFGLQINRRHFYTESLSLPLYLTDKDIEEII